MTDAPYRDALAARRERVLDMVEEATRLDEAINDAVRGDLPRELVREMARARIGAKAPIDSMESAARVEEHATAYLTHARRATELAPELERTFLELPLDAPPLHEDWTWTEVDPSAIESATSLAQACERFLGARFFGATRGDKAIFSYRGAPFVAVQTPADIAGDRAHIELATSVPRAMPELHLKAESVSDLFGKAVGVTHDVELGEEVFDGLFLVEGQAAAARLLLSSPVRSALIGLAHYDVPELSVAFGAARLSWRAAPDPDDANRGPLWCAMVSAATALSALRLIRVT